MFINTLMSAEADAISGAIAGLLLALRAARMSPTRQTQLLHRITDH